MLEVLIVFIVALPDLFQSYSAKFFKNHRYMWTLKRRQQTSRTSGKNGEV